MARRDSGKLGVFGTIALLVVAALATVAVVWGPRLWREGRAVGVPLIDLARAESRLDRLDEELPFAPPEDGVIPAERLEAFLELRAGLKPHYEEWQALVTEVERTGEESWDTAREVITATRDVIVAQIEGLERARMSKAEFRWLETAVYDQWLDGGADDPLEGRLAGLTREDLAFLEELDRQIGPSRAATRMRERLERRLAELGGAEPAPGPNDALLEAHRERIASLRLDRFREIHEHLSRGGSERGVKVTIGGEREAETE